MSVEEGNKDFGAVSQTDLTRVKFRLAQARFVTTIFRSTQRYNIGETLFRMAALFQPWNPVLR